MLYFVKDHLIHRFPTPKRCGARHTNEQIRDTKPHDADDCIYCLNRWPSDEGRWS